MDVQGLLRTAQEHHLRGPRFEGIGPVFFGWTNAKLDSCETLKATFWIASPHEVWLYGVNSHGVEERLLYQVEVIPVGEDIKNTLPRDATDLDYRPGAQNALQKMNAVIRFFQWLLT